MNLSWTPFFEELLSVICEKYDSKTLVEIFHKIFHQASGDKIQDGDEEALIEIDPLTFIAYFNRQEKLQRKLDYCHKIKETLNLKAQPPQDFDGIPQFSNQNSRFFPHKREREDDVIPCLWQFAKALNENRITNEIFARTLDIKMVAIAKLSQICFICKPNSYLPLDKNTIMHLESLSLSNEAKNVLNETTFSAYQKLISKAKELVPHQNFSQLSAHAYSKDSTLLTTPEILVKIDAAIKDWGWDSCEEIAEKIGLSTDLVWNRWQEAFAEPARKLIEEGKSNEEIRALLGIPNTSIGAFRAHDTMRKRKQKRGRAGTDNENYWIFQCNPKRYNVVEAIREKHLNSWNVATHREKIKPGDKGIIWVVGENSGCYALVTIESDPYTRKDNTNEESHSFETGQSTLSLRCDISIEFPLIDHPILKERIENEMWFKNFKGGNQGTNFQLTKDEYLNFLALAENGNSIAGKNNSGHLPTHHLNTILYGPPGTGKTYQTVYRALEIIEGNSFQNSKNEFERRAKAMARFRELKNSGKIGFIVFHQSYSYEDFIEGIRPKTKENKESDKITYSIEPGHFKSFVTEMRNTIATTEISGASANPTIWRISLRADKEDLSLNCINSGVIGVNFEAETDFRNLEVKDFYASQSNQAGRITLNLFKNKMRLGDIVCVFKDEESIMATGIITGDYDYSKNNTPFPHYRKVKWIDTKEHNIFKINDSKKMKTPTLHRLSSIDISSLMELIKPQPFEYKEKKNEGNYVFIVDEINRGNISRIFGEIITLIEEDKRGTSTGYSVALTYSKEQFSLPKNLYIIGTMNTADRSIATLDIALRRRFHFTEICPNSKLVVPDICGVNFKKVFEELNNKIVLIQGRDYQIGHSYFLADRIKSLADLKEVWFNQLIPLLWEYLYEEWDKLRALIPSFIKEDTILGLENITTKNECLYEFVKQDISDADFITRLKELENCSRSEKRSETPSDFDKVAS